MKVKILRCLKPDNPVQSIKTIRCNTFPNLGLKEAKDAFDSVKNSGINVVLDIIQAPSPDFQEHFAYEVFVADAMDTMSNHEKAMHYLTHYVRDLLDEKKYEAATNASNLLTLLSKIQEESVS